MEGCPVTRVLVEDGKVGIIVNRILGLGQGVLLLDGKKCRQKIHLDEKVVGVETPEGKVATSRVVLSAGAWSKQLGQSSSAIKNWSQ